jgi:hypothetical protein
MLSLSASSGECISTTARWRATQNSLMQRYSCLGCKRRRRDSLGNTVGQAWPEDNYSCTSLKHACHTYSKHVCHTICAGVDGHHLQHSCENNGDGASYERIPQLFQVHALMMMQINLDQLLGGTAVNDTMCHDSRWFVCSQDVGAEKPDKAIFDAAFDQARFWMPGVSIGLAPAWPEIMKFTPCIITYSVHP